MTGLRIIDCGAGTTLQDQGRFGFRRFGVSTSGFADNASAAFANALVGNPPFEACVEFQMAGGRLAVENGQVAVALTGPNCALRVGGRVVRGNRSAVAEHGDIVEVGPVRGGVYAYLAIGGGFDLAAEMGSLSVHVRSGIGGGALAPGDRLPARAPGRGKLREAGPFAAAAGPIRFVAGPQDDHFAAEATTILANSPFKVRHDSDRMAYRLSGPVLRHAGDANIVSDGVLPGSIQVPGDGVPTILLRDCPTTGGYPKIATVISADLDRLSQIAPGGIVRFSAVTLDEAVAAARLARKRMARTLSAIRSFSPEPTAESLLRANLIDGITDGR